MTNIQLYQKFASDKLFEKTNEVSLSHLLTFVQLYDTLTPEEVEEIKYVTTKVSEWRDKQKDIKTTVIY